MTGSLVAIAGLVFVAAITPGPNNFIILSRAVHGGWVGTLPAILGVVVGSLCVLAAVVMGLDALPGAAGLVRSIILWAGCLYLGFLGARMLLRPEAMGAEASGPHGFVALAGFQVVNPKTWVLVGTAYAALVERSEAGQSDWAVLACVLVAVTVPCLLVWSAAGMALKNIMSDERTGGMVQRCLGAGLVVSAAMLLV